MLADMALLKQNKAMLINLGMYWKPQVLWHIHVQLFLYPSQVAVV